MLTEQNMEEVVTSLLKGTREQRVSWRLEREQFRAERIPGREGLPISFVEHGFVAIFEHSVIRFVCSLVEGKLDLARFSFFDRAKKHLGSWHLAVGAKGWKLASELYLAVLQGLRVDGVVMDADVLLRDVEKAGGSDVQAEGFFAWAAGYWRLTFDARQGTGTEVLRLDEQGRYFTAKHNEAPYYFLRDVFFDQESRRVSFSKVFASGENVGKVRQREVLEMDDDILSGYAEHDGHRLRYERITKEDADW